MVSDQDIARGVEFLLLRDPTALHHNDVVSSVVHQLSLNLGLDLSDKVGFISDHINLLRHLYSRRHVRPSGFGNDHFALQTQHQFIQQSYHQQQQQHLPEQPQQQRVLNPPFTLHYGGYPHVPPPQQQQHATSPIPRQQHVTPAPPVKKVAATLKASSESTQAGTKKRGGSGGLNKLCAVSQELQAIVGEATMSRTEIVRQLWVYIRKNNLQDPSNKRKIICDEALRAVLETDCTDMFKMNKLLAKHILPLDPTKAFVQPKRQRLDVEDGAEPAETVETAEPVETAKPAETVETAEPAETVETAEPAETVETAEPAETVETAEPAETVETAEPAETVETAEPAETVRGAEPAETVEGAEPVIAAAVETVKTADSVKAVDTVKAADTSKVVSLVTISDALADFLGTTKREMLASEAIQHVYEYVKLNSLEDTDSMIVACNDKLKELLGCESIPLLEINETVARRHLLQSL